MPPPTAILPEVQRGAMDCGLMALRYYTGLAYNQIAEVAKRVTPHHHNSLWQRELVRLAAKLGVRLARLSHPQDWRDEDCGLLLVANAKGDRHWVLWFYGALVNPADGLLWAPDVYLATRRIVAAYVEEEG